MAAVVASAPPGSPPSTAAAPVFASWRRELEALLAASGVAAERCPVLDLDLTSVATVEGPLVLARADGDVATFDAVVEQLVRLVEC